MKRSVIPLVTALFALFFPLLAVSARDAKVLHVGVVSYSPLASSPTRQAFLRRMVELGYGQGRNFLFDFIHAMDSAEYMRGYKQLVARKVDILLADGPEQSLHSALAATRSIPIVMVAVDFDPIARGYVADLAHPGGNVTGLFFQQIELTTKRLQLMKEAFPNIKAATVFWDQISADQWQTTQIAARELGYPVYGVEMRKRPYDYGPAFARVPQLYKGAIMVLASPLFRLPTRRTLPDFAMRHHLPTMFFVRWYPDEGGLMSYGVSFSRLFRRAAEYVDKIAKGAKPADLPIEQPTKFELVVNLKTAKALGMAIPRSILLRADEVIE